MVTQFVSYGFSFKDNVKKLKFMTNDIKINYVKDNAYIIFIVTRCTIKDHAIKHFLGCADALIDNYGNIYIVEKIPEYSDNGPILEYTLFRSGGSYYLLEESISRLNIDYFKSDIYLCTYCSDHSKYRTTSSCNCGNKLLTSEDMIKCLYSIIDSCIYESKLKIYESKLKYESVIKEYKEKLKELQDKCDSRIEQVYDKLIEIKKENLKLKEFITDYIITHK